MRSHWVGIALAVLVGACGGDDPASVDMKVPSDFSASADFASSPFAGVHCGDMSCPGSTVCCVRPEGASFGETCETPMACMTGGAAAICDGSEDCPAEKQSCCASVSFMRVGQGAVPLGGSSACVSDCAASVFADTATISFNSKLCHVTTDCAGYMGDLYGSQIPFDGCCYRPEIDLRFCAPKDKSYSSIGGYYCLDTL